VPCILCVVRYVSELVVRHAWLEGSEGEQAC